MASGERQIRSSALAARQLLSTSLLADELGSSEEEYEVSIHEKLAPSH